VAVAFVSSSASTTNTTTVTKPSGLSVGDALLVVCEDGTLNTALSGSTFLDLGTYKFGSTNNWLHVFGRIIDGTEPSTFTASASTNYKCVAYSGVAGIPSLIGGAAYPTASVTSLDCRYRAPVDGMVVHIFSTSGTSNPVITAPGSGVTDRGGFTNRTFWAVDVCDETVTAGDDNTRNATQAGGTSQLGNTLTFMLPSSVSIPAVVGSATNSGNSTNASITIPSTAQVGDMFLCAFSTIAAAGAISAGPTGFTPLDGPGNNTGGSQRSNYWWGYKILVSGDPGSTINVTSGSQVWGSAGIVIRNPNGILATGTMTHGTSTTPPLVNTAGGGPAAIAVSALIFSNSSGNSGHILDTATIKGVTWRSDIAVSSGFGAAALAVHSVPPSGSALAPVVTLTSSPTWETNTVLLALGASGVSASGTGAHTSGGTAAGVVGTAATAAGAHTAGATAVGSVGTSASATGAHTSGGDADGTVVAGLSRDATGDHVADATATGTVASERTALAIHVADATAAGVVGKVATATADHTADAAAEGTDVVGPHASATGDHVADATAFGFVTVIPTTQISWTDGRRREGIGTASWEPPVVALPKPVPSSARLMKAQAFDAVAIAGATAKVTSTTVAIPRPRHRIVVAGGDRTVIRGIETPEPTQGLIEPLLYGSGSIQWPQFHGAFEKPGQGDWAWLKKYAPLKIQRVDDNNHVVATDFRGFIGDYNDSGRALTTAILGEATGRAGRTWRPDPIFPTIQDIGHLSMMAIRHGLALPTMANPPVTGIEVPNSGDTWQLDFLTDLTARSTTLGGAQWTIMPNADGVYRMFRKDITTIDFTVYCDDTRAVANLRRDFAQEPDREFVTAIGRNGMRIRFAKYPGLSTIQDPPPFPGHLEQGDTGDDVFQLSWRLWVLGYLDGQGGGTPPTPDVFTAGLTKAVKALQRQFNDDLDVTGEVDAATWRAAFNNDGQWSLRGAAIHPAAQRPFTRTFNYNASGQITGRNPKSDRHRVFADRAVNMGNVQDRGQARDWAQNDLSDDASPNLVGTIDLTMGAVIAGEHHPGDPLTVDLVMDNRAIKPGMNGLIHYQGAPVLMHVASRDLNQDKTVQIAVDTRNRDALEVWEIHELRRESHQNPARQWRNQARSSSLTRDSMTGWDEIGGLIDSRITAPGGAWCVFPVVAGEEGQIRDLTVTTVDDPAEFIMAVFGAEISAERITAMIGDPFTDDGKRNWRRKNDTLTDDHYLLYEAGWDGNPLGYHPTTKADATADFPEKGVDQVTGRWRDPAGFPYFCYRQPVVWVTLFPRWDTHLNPGRIFRVQQNDQV